MRLYHWNSQNVDILVVALSVEDARRAVTELLNRTRWQNPDRIDAILKDVAGDPLFVADPGHVITVDRS